MSSDKYKLSWKNLDVDIDEDPRLLNPSESTSTHVVKFQEKPIKSNLSNPIDYDDTMLSIIPGLGDLYDVTNIIGNLETENYKQAILNTGLLLIPNIIEKPLKIAGKIIRNKVIDKIKPLRERYYRKQNQAVLDGFHETFKNVTGNSHINSTVNPYLPNARTIILDPNVRSRMDKSFIKADDISLYPVDPYDKVNIHLVDNSGNYQTIKDYTADKLSTFEYELALEELKNNLMSNNSALGITNRNPKFSPVIMIKRYYDGNLRSLKDMKGTAAHEALHAINTWIKYDYAKLDNLGYKIPNPDTYFGKLLDKNLGFKYPDSDFYESYKHWSRSPEELQANIYQFRALHNIGSRNLTDKEAIKFIKTYGPFHFNNDNLNVIKKITKFIPGFAGLYFLTQDQKKTKEI